MAVNDWEARIRGCEQERAEAQLQLVAARVQEVVTSYSLPSARMRRDAQGFHLVDVVDVTGAVRQRGDTIHAHLSLWRKDPKVHEISFDDFEVYLRDSCEELYTLVGCDRIHIEHAGLPDINDVWERVAAASRSLFVAQCAALLHQTPDLHHFRYTWLREFDDMGGHDIRDLQVSAINGGDPEGDPALPAIQALLDAYQDSFSMAFTGRNEDILYMIDVSTAGVEVVLDHYQ